MANSLRTIVVGPDDALYLLPNAKFSRMFDDPENNRLERFAGQRMRAAEAVVALHKRKPCAVVRIVYEMLSFDAEGRFDLDAFWRQSAALPLPSIPGYERERQVTKVVDASDHFIARGGRWQPSHSLEQRILSAALGELKCKRL